MIHNGGFFSSFFFTWYCPRGGNRWSITAPPLEHRLLNNIHKRHWEAGGQSPPRTLAHSNYIHTFLLLPYYIHKQPAGPVAVGATQSHHLLHGATETWQYQVGRRSRLTVRLGRIVDFTKSSTRRWRDRWTFLGRGTKHVSNKAW